MTPFDQNIDTDAGHTIDPSIDQDDLIAFHLRELPRQQKLAVLRALQNNPNLRAESMAIASTLRAFPKHEAPLPLDTAALDRHWLTLRRSLPIHVPPAVASRSLFSRWAIPTLAASALAATALILSLHHNPHTNPSTLATSKSPSFAITTPQLTKSAVPSDSTVPPYTAVPSNVAVSSPNSLLLSPPRLPHPPSHAATSRRPAPVTTTPPTSPLPPSATSPLTAPSPPLPEPESPPPTRNPQLHPSARSRPFINNSAPGSAIASPAATPIPPSNTPTQPRSAAPETSSRNASTSSPRPTSYRARTVTASPPPPKPAPPSWPFTRQTPISPSRHPTPRTSRQASSASPPSSPSPGTWPFTPATAPCSTTSPPTIPPTAPPSPQLPETSPSPANPSPASPIASTQPANNKPPNQSRAALAFPPKLHPRRFQ
jgi:hypothetical protein